MAKLVDVGSIATHFESLEDPRHTRNRKHLLADIAVICVAAIVCGCDGPTAIHRWAALRKDWLAERLPLANGVPSTRTRPVSARQSSRSRRIAPSPDAADARAANASTTSKPTLWRVPL